MTISTLTAGLLASPFNGSLLGLVGELLPLILGLGRLIVRFRSGEITPANTCAFEKDLQALLRDMGQVIVAWLYNRLEPAAPTQAAEMVVVEGERYRRRAPSPRRGGIATLFGIIALWRIRYEPLEAGLPCVFPLEMRLGVAVGRRWRNASASGRRSIRKRRCWTCWPRSTR